MIAYCGCPPAASSCDPFPYIVPAMRGKRSQESARWGRLLRAHCALTGGPGQALAGSPCDARVAPLATAIIRQTGSYGFHASLRSRKIARLELERLMRSDRLWPK